MNKTVVMSARIDIIDLANVVKYLESVGVKPTSKSDILWRVCKIISNTAIKKGGIEFCETVEDALNSLKKSGIDITVGERARRGVMNALQEEALDADFVQAVDVSRLSMRDQYEAACIVARQLGIQPVSFEEFKKEKESV